MDSTEYYNRISSGYEELHSDEQEKKLEIIKKALQGKIRKGWKLLDAGCGTGITSIFNCAVFGIDPAVKLLEKAKTKRKPDYAVCAEAEHLPFKDGSFDAVVSVTALQNFHDIGRGMDEIKRVGRKGCVFALSFLKKSEKKEFILEEIGKRFRIDEEIDEEKDIILFCE